LVIVQCLSRATGKRSEVWKHVLLNAGNTTFTSRSKHHFFF